MKKARAEIGRLDPLITTAGTGALGRLSDVLTKNGYKVNAFGIDTDLAALEGTRKDSIKRATDSTIGFQRFNPSADLGNGLQAEVRNLNRASDEYNNIFSDTMSATMVRIDYCFVFGLKMKY